ncbi:MAG: hypothetical protein IID30_11085 [Planctomycetes bacterium]|nr:hypothetical protein [Planctomycetota bacterium]
MFRKTTIKDARGRKIDFLVGMDWSSAGMNLSKGDQRSLDNIFHEDIQRESAKWILTSPLGRQEIVFILGGMIMFALASVCATYLTPSGPTWFKTVLQGLFFGAYLLLWSILIFKWRCRSLSLDRPFPKAVLGFGHCPACLYDLQQLAPVESDGCTVCPECGGAWKLP